MLAIKRVVLIGILVVVGIATVATTPETPAETIESFLQAASNEGRIPDTVLQQYEELSDDAKEVTAATWVLISDETPDPLIDEHVEWLVGVVSSSDQGSLASQSCCFIYDLFAANGYSSALSAMPGGASLLEAKVATQGYSRTNSCRSDRRNCVAITAWILKPTGKGTWVVHGQHRSRNPSRDRVSFAIVRID